jgi:hypothetical protein
VKDLLGEGLGMRDHTNQFDAFALVAPSGQSDEIETYFFENYWKQLRAKRFYFFLTTVLKRNTFCFPFSCTRQM